MKRPPALTERPLRAASSMNPGAGAGRTAIVKPEPRKLVDLKTRSGSSSVIDGNDQAGAAYELVLADAGKIVRMSNAAANVVTIPADATVDFPVGSVLEVQQIGAGATSIAGAAGVTVNSPGGLLQVAQQWGIVALRKTGADAWDVEGDLGGGSSIEVVSINTQVASYVLALTDASRLVKMDVAAANTVTIPPQATVDFPVGTTLEVMQYGAGKTTIVAGAGVTLRSPGGTLGIASRYGMLALTKIGSDEWGVEGRLG